jgi:hypothetical protein
MAGFSSSASDVISDYDHCTITLRAFRRNKEFFIMGFGTGENPMTLQIKRH